MGALMAESAKHLLLRQAGQFDLDVLMHTAPPGACVLLLPGFHSIVQYGPAIIESGDVNFFGRGLACIYHNAFEDGHNGEAGRYTLVVRGEDVTPTFHGIFVAGKCCQCEKGCAVQVTQDAAPTFIDCKFTSAFRDGIVFEHGGCGLIQGGRVPNAGVVIRGRGTAPTLRGVTICNSGGLAAIRIVDKAAPTIDGCRIIDGGKHRHQEFDNTSCIYCFKTGPGLIKRTAVTGCPGHGIDLVQNSRRRRLKTITVAPDCVLDGNGKKGLNTRSKTKNDHELASSEYYFDRSDYDAEDFSLTPRTDSEPDSDYTPEAFEE